MNMHQTPWWLTDTIIEYMLYVVGPSSETWIMPVEHSNHMQLTNALCVVASLNSISCPQPIFSNHTEKGEKKKEKTETFEWQKNSRPTYPVGHTKRHHPFHSMTGMSLRWFYSGTAWYLSVADLNSSCCCLSSSSSVRPLCSILLCFFSRDYNEDQRLAWDPRWHRCKQTWIYLQLLLVFFGNSEYISDIITETEIPQCLLHMFTSDSLLGLLFADIVRLGGDQCDEFYTAFHEQVACILWEGLAGARW